MWRSVLGVAVGAALWMVAFFALAIVLGQFWPDYAMHARDWLNDSVFTFTSAMAVCNLVLWVAAEVFARWLTMKIARSDRALLALIVPV
jgi:hypothetical protein